MYHAGQHEVEPFKPFGKGGAMSAEYVTKADVTELIAASETRLIERMEGLAERMEGLTERVETRLLTEFHKYAQAAESRMHLYEVQSHSLVERMAAIETRVRELERRR
jgi:predicted component of type VI protein secretion system